MNKILAIAVMLAAAQARAGGPALEALGVLAGGAAAKPPVPAAPAAACAEPGPGASVEEVSAWIQCVELPAPPASAQAVQSADFFDEWGDGAERIPAALSAAGIEVVEARNSGNITTVRYRAAAALVREEETRGEYGPGDGAKIDREARAIKRRLEAQGKTVIWTGRWGDIINGATVYYLEPRVRTAGVPGPAAVSPFAGLFDEINPEACPGARPLGDGAALCRVKGAAHVHSLPALRKHRIERLPWAGTWDAVSLNLRPDDSTSLIYEYSYELRGRDGRLAGYAQRHGYANSEFGGRLDLLLKYTPAGELASVTAF